MTGYWLSLKFLVLSTAYPVYPTRSYVGPVYQTLGISTLIVFKYYPGSLLTNGWADVGGISTTTELLAQSAESVPAIITTLTISTAASQ